MNFTLESFIIALLATTMLLPSGAIRPSSSSSSPSTTAIAPAFSIRHPTPKRERAASRPSSFLCPLRRKHARTSHTTATATATGNNDDAIATTAQLDADEPTTPKNNHDGYPLRIHHEGRVSTIYVRENEPILHAMERQSSKPAAQTADPASSSSSCLALSDVPNDCRRGNCLTCASRIILPSSPDDEDTDGTEKGSRPRIVANVDNGLSPVMASHLQKSNYILTCCSYVTRRMCPRDDHATNAKSGRELSTGDEPDRGGSATREDVDIQPIGLEIDQSHRIWEEFYRNKLNPVGQSGRDARARLLRRVSEENVGKWKERMEVVWKESGGEDGDDDDVVDGYLGSV
ncbi:hypothetical protein ACHAXS_008992 [Conticribra weissflogii]